jgi:hypothetical protein
MLCFYTSSSFHSDDAECDAKDCNLFSRLKIHFGLHLFPAFGDLLSLAQEAGGEKGV